MLNEIALYKNESVLYRNHTDEQMVDEMFELARQGQSNSIIENISNNASHIRNNEQRNKYILQSVYDLAVYRSSPPDRQQLKTVSNIIRSRTANCTGYTTLIASVLNNLNQPYFMRLTDTKNEGFDHIYLITQNFVLDCVLSQAQNEQDTFTNRFSKPFFGHEANYFYKKDFSNMLTVVNGRVRSSRSQINGLFDTFADVLGDECKRACDVKYLSDKTSRIACKDECSANVYTAPDIRMGTQNQQSITNYLLIAAAVGGGVYLLTRK